MSNLLKAENPQKYKEYAEKGLMVAHSVKINGKAARDDNGIHYHSTIKFFDPSKDHPHAVHNVAKELTMNPPNPKNVGIEPGMFKDRNGDDVYVLKLKGGDADRIKEHNQRFSHMGYPATFDYQAHVSVDKATHDRIKASGAKTAQEAGLEFGPAELRQGHNVLATYNHPMLDNTPVEQHDPIVPIRTEKDHKKLAASEKMVGVPLMKPYVSEAQRRWAHTASGKEALGGEAGVHEWDEASKGKKLPEKVEKSEDGPLIPPPSATTYKELKLHHGTKAKEHFDHFDLKHHQSGFYPGVYTSSNKEETAKHGTHVPVDFKGHVFEIKSPKHAEQLQDHVKGGGSGHKLAEHLKAAGYHAIKRGSEHIILHPEHAKIEKSEELLENVAKNDLQKGTMQRLAPFKPDPTSEMNSKVAAWQLRPLENSQARNHFAMSPEGKARAMHKLHSQTNVRKNPKTGGREFLLHRGMSANEHVDSHKNTGFVSHSNATSWTPDHRIASQFAHIHGNNGELASAWIPESAITHVPNQEGKNNNGSEKGQNDWHNEREVIVGPHSSQLANPEEITSARRNLDTTHLYDVPKKPAARPDLNDVISTRKMGRAPLFFKKSEELLEKGALKNAVTGAAMIGASLAHTPAASAPSAQQGDFYNHEKMLRAISQVESQGGKNINHEAMGGMHHGNHAYGKYGISPALTQETIRLNPDLKSSHGKALALKGDTINKYLQDNPGLEDKIADKHLARLEHHFGNDPEMISMAWLNGISGANKAKNNGEDISNHWHIKKVKDAYVKDGK